MSNSLLIHELEIVKGSFFSNQVEEDESININLAEAVKKNLEEIAKLKKQPTPPPSPIKGESIKLGKWIKNMPGNWSAQMQEIEDLQQELSILENASTSNSHISEQNFENGDSDLEPANQSLEEESKNDKSKEDTKSMEDTVTQIENNDEEEEVDELTKMKVQLELIGGLT